MAQFVASVVTMLLVLPVILGGVAYSILLERKIASWVQNRIGPNRVGFGFGQADLLEKVGLGKLAHFHFWGFGQPAADGLKMLLKEDYTPDHVERVLFMLAPVMVIVPALLGWAIIPWGGYLQYDGQALAIMPLPISIGAIYLLAIGSMAVYGVVVGGYASNNKYSFLGGLRATAQMLSYEIPLGLAVLIIILMAGSARTDTIVHLQANGVWNIFYQPLLVLIFFTCILAEANRAPFDLAEAEQELVGGYHTEYSSMKFALFFLGEYIHMIASSAFLAVLFLGGWDLPIVQEPLVGGIALVLLKFAVFAFKVFLIVAFMMLVRWTIPRFRFDQLMRMAWRSLIPLTIFMLLGSGVVVALKLSPWWHVLVNAAAAAVTLTVGQLLPQGPPVNRRVPLEGSRFSPLMQ